MRGDGPDQTARDVEGEVDRALGREVPMSEQGPDQPALVEREVRLFVSKDTEALWEALALRMGLASFDALVQVLCMYGAFLVASADLGYLENLHLDDLGPEAIRAVVHPWLEARAPSPGMAKGENDDDGG